MDLGNLLGDLGGAFINARYGGQPTSGPFVPTGYGPIAATPAFNDTFGSGLPGGDFIGNPPNDGKRYVLDPGANCGQGKWILKRRRRHRNLATRGDIRDLSALKGVLGTGKLLETWIATHS